MEKIYIKARGKVNLVLNILNKREDNYHNLESIFQKISLYDELFIKKTNNNRIIIKTNIEELNNKENIIYKAYELLKKAYKDITGIEVILNKNIPMQAGLAGGSTDCASFILGMNKLFDLNLNQIKLIDIGKKLGADVVPCFYNSTIKAEGIGEIITKINSNAKYYILIIKPEISCSTKVMFEKLDKQNRKVSNYNLEKMIKVLEENNIKEIANNLYNDFEKVIEPRKILLEIKKDLKNAGAIGSLLTGSGSCVYGIFENKEKIKNANEMLKTKYKTYMCKTYNLKEKKDGVSKRKMD